jgi:tetratricopeptide (TPR) repeat protein
MSVGLINYLQSSWQQFLELKPIEQLSAVFGIGLPIATLLFAQWKLVTRELRLKREELHKLQELSDNRLQQIKTLQQEAQTKDATIAGLEAQFPEHWLKQAAKERENGNEERAIRGLRLGFESLREPLSACCLDLAGHHFSLASDYGAAHFGEAERLARLAALLNPADKDAQAFLLEILAVAAEGHYAAGDYAGFDTLWEEAEDFLGAGDDPASIASIENRARQHYEQGHYRLAVRLYRRLAQMSQRHFGPDSQTTLTLRASLTVALDNAGNYSEALALSQAVLADSERVLGPDHPHVATSLNNLAALYEAQGEYAQAEPLFLRSLAIGEKALGPDHPDVAIRLNNLAALYVDQGQYAQAEPLYQRSLAIWERALGHGHPNVAASLNNLANLYQAQSEYAQAEPLYQRALAIWEKSLGTNHPDVATCLRNYAALLRQLDRAAEAEAMEARAQAIEATQPPSPTQDSAG